MIIVRLKRKSSGQNLTYSVVVVNNTAASKSSQVIEYIGSYNPLVDKWSNKYFLINFDRLKFWLERGAAINKSLFLILKGLLSLKSLSTISAQVEQGHTHFAIKKKTLD